MISFIYKLAKEMNDKMLSLRLNQSFFKVTKKRWFKFRMSEKRED